MWVQLIIAIAMAVISYALTPKPKVQSPTAGTLDIPAPKLGEPVPVVFGEVWIQDAAISYYGNSNTAKIKSKGGK
jgi:hypothetical protein